MNQDPAGGISPPDLRAILVPVASINQGFVAVITCQLYDSKGTLIWRTEVRGVAPEEKLGSPKIYEEALVALAHALLASRDVDLWAREVSPEFAATAGPPPLSSLLHPY